MYCAQCGTLASADCKFCVACGSQISNPAAGTLALTRDGEAALLASVRRALAADYDVDREIGRGGMAVVFRARDKELDRRVALKVLPPELVPVASVAERFKREARLAASLDHPNIIPVYRVGQSSGVLYMAMKLIDGCGLDTLVSRHGALPLPVVLTVLRASARAVAFAHDHGIIHRDVKPANILVDRDGRVVVSDFGIARAVEASKLTATGTMVGTPHYMSPEQCAGKGLGPQSDQYSLGIVAFQMLTGEVPFDGDSLPEILQHHCFTPPPDASLMRPDSPAALTAIVLRLLTKDPSQRFQSTHDLTRALDAIPFTEADRAEGEATLRAMVAAAAGPALSPTPTVPHVAFQSASPPQSVSPIQAVPKLAPSPSPVPATRIVTLAANAVQKRPPNPTGPRGRPTQGRGRGRGRGTSRWVSKLVVGTAALAGIALVGIGASHRRAAAAAAAAESGDGRGLTVTELRKVGGRAYHSGDYELARRFFLRAVQAAPADRYAHEDLGCALLKLDRPFRAEEQFQLAGSTTAQSSKACDIRARP
jgi:serine/threonine protein kinase